MRISDWSSDVCSSDLAERDTDAGFREARGIGAAVVAQRIEVRGSDGGGRQPRPVGGGQRMAVGVAFGGAEDVAIVAHVLRGEAGSGGHLDEGAGVEGAARYRVDERLARQVRA